MRIVGGEYARRLLKTPSGFSTRPTLARVREALFNAMRGRLVDARVLDLYAGSGALALEALSWGAGSAVLVEPHHKARAIIFDNIKALALSDRATVLPYKAESALDRLIRDGEQFQLVLCDPPWQSGIVEAVTARLHRVLAPDGWVVVEHPAGAEPPKIIRMECFKRRRYGGTALAFYRLFGDRPSETEPEENR